MHFILRIQFKICLISSPNFPALHVILTFAQSNNIQSNITQRGYLKNITVLENNTFAKIIERKGHETEVWMPGWPMQVNRNLSQSQCTQI